MAMIKNTKILSDCFKVKNNQMNVIKLLLKVKTTEISQFKQCQTIFEMSTIIDEVTHMIYLISLFFLGGGGLDNFNNFRI